MELTAIFMYDSAKKKSRVEGRGWRARAEQTNKNAARRIGRRSGLRLTTFRYALRRRRKYNLPGRPMSSRAQLPGAGTGTETQATQPEVPRGAYEVTIRTAPEAREDFAAHQQ